MRQALVLGEPIRDRHAHETRWDPGQDRVVLAANRGRSPDIRESTAEITGKY